jgi:hypothetical protein
MRTKLVLLDVFAIVFSWAWIAAGALALYFLYGAVSSGGSWRNMILATIATIGAKLLAEMLGQNRHSGSLCRLAHRPRRGIQPPDEPATVRHGPSRHEYQPGNKQAALVDGEAADRVDRRRQPGQRSGR